jgi:hypothetical protein
VRHKNVVQFIGACTRKPNLCIVFEYMSHGSVYDWVRREGPLRLSVALKVALEVSRGMDYLHQRKIIHRRARALGGLGPGGLRFCLDGARRGLAGRASLAGAQQPWVGPPIGPPPRPAQSAGSA